MSAYPLIRYDHHPSQLAVSRQAADRYALSSALAQNRVPRRPWTVTPVRRLRRAVARHLVRTARLVDAS